MTVNNPIALKPTIRAFSSTLHLFLHLSVVYIVDKVSLSYLSLLNGLSNSILRSFM